MPVIMTRINNDKYDGPLYRRAEMYAGRFACCSLVSHSDYADRTERRTDARSLHYDFVRRGQRYKLHYRYWVYIYK